MLPVNETLNQQRPVCKRPLDGTTLALLFLRRAQEADKAGPVWPSLSVTALEKTITLALSILYFNETLAPVSCDTPGILVREGLFQSTWLLLLCDADT